MKLCLLTPEIACSFTASVGSASVILEHQRRFLEHTHLQSIQWVHLQAQTVAVLSGSNFCQIAEAARGGNKFANANKLADHYFAYGSKAAILPPRRLHSGAGLTPDMARAAGAALDRHGFMLRKDEGVC